MRVLVVTPPQPVVSLEEAKAQMRILHSHEDTLITRLIKTATAYIDGPDRWVGAAIGRQTLEFRLNGFVCSDIRLPCPPIIGVESVKYLDAGGVEQTMDQDDYELIGRDLSAVWGKSWPATRAAREAVRIRYTAGFDPVPEDVRGGIIAAVADMFENRETTVTEAGQRALEWAVQGIRTFA